MTTKIRLFGVMLLLTGLNNLLAVPQQNNLIDRIIARVDDQILLQSELEKEYQYYQAQGGEKVADLRCKILEGLLINKMLLARASLEGGIPTQEDVDHYFDYRMQELLNQAGSEANIAAYTGKPIQTFKEELRNAIQEQRTLDKMRHQIIQNMHITPAEVQAFFHALPTHNLPYYPAAVEVRQIVRYPKMCQQDKIAIKAHILALKERIQAGEDFGQLAQQYSQDIRTASHGGELGFWRIGDLEDQAYEAAALALKPGEIAAPVETQAGFYLIQLTACQENKYNTRHILIKPSFSTHALQEAQLQVDSIRTAILEKETTFEKAALTYSEDIATAQQEGLIAHTDHGSSIPIDALPPDIFFAVDTLTPGSISATTVFTTEEGKQAIRILYLKEKILAHQANLQQDYEKIAQLALNAKKTKKVREWFQAVKEEAIIQIDPAYAACKILE